MAKKIYIRTPEAQTIAQDFDFEAKNTAKLPEITADNLDEQVARCIGFIGGVPQYHNGTGMVPFASAKISFPITTDLSIAWQTELVPSTTKTYAATFGNDIFKAIITGNDGSGNFTPYEANISYTKTGELINILSVQNILYAGKLTFI